MKFPELTYATPSDPAWKRLTIQTMERWAGRDYFVPHYETWRRDIVGQKPHIMRPALDLLKVDLQLASGQWPPKLDQDAPLVVVSNHPFGILDGFAALALAEELGRPFKVLIHKDLIRVPEIRPYSLPIDFAETREAQAANIETRRTALRLLAEGTTIVVFPAGGVATSPTVFGRAVDLPWKTFTARMIQASKAQVLPLYIEGQCSPLFHLVSKYSLTLRLSIIIREFRRKVGEPLRVHIGEVIPFEAIEARTDRKAVMRMLYDRVHAMSG
ncbi:MAG TPA: lysophospholipid acyltransferase family protein, partial [Hyphomicrobiaceae bacterium]|nr:lysophospholipid acyltransferase family protein [Hyphomicrobiaceae bacterium]